MINGHRRWLLSGGIGCGKSAVRVILKRSGWHAIDADSIGHTVLDAGGSAIREIEERWPHVIVDGRVDRFALGRVVFEDAGELKELERITHPHIFGKILSDIQEKDGPVVVEIPLLKNPFDEGWRRIVVDSVDHERRRRLQGRGMNAADVEARMRAQPHRPAWLAAADLVVPNHGSLDELEDTVMKVVR